MLETPCGADRRPLPTRAPLFVAAAGNMFEPGAFSPGSRLLNFVFKGAIFSVIGMMAGTIGTATSNGLLELRCVSGGRGGGGASAC